MLVKHSYQPGWFLPGGGVKKKETLEAAARREAWEEVGAQLGELRLLGIYSRLKPHKSDHVVVYTCCDMVLEGSPDYEIESFDFFPLDDLPVGVSKGSLRRIEEYANGRQDSGTTIW
jgi:8-oxo-dGTP pyrophosphatase MutT (NUDIX family)